MKRRVLPFLIILLCVPMLMGAWGKPRKKAAKPKAEAAAQATLNQAPRAGVGNADGSPDMTSPGEYGNIVLNRYTGDGKSARAVVFPHWWHRTQYTCKACHIDLGIKLEAGAADMKMADIDSGKFCGKCHNGEAAFATTASCDRCHSQGIEVPENRKFESITHDFPKDCCGNRVNWVKALDEGNIAPKPSVNGTGEMMIADFIVERPIKDGIIPNVLYPHKPHTQVLACDNCHPSIFTPKAGKTPITMTKINAGNYCGVCHGKVAFPIEDCFRCHSKR
ncbi:MAG: c(7)-type cytochrome triheme domain-containing protein [Thermodesulfobacteriota bacterium]